MKVTWHILTNQTVGLIHFQISERRRARENTEEEEEEEEDEDEKEAAIVNSANVANKSNLRQRK